MRVTQRVAAGLWERWAVLFVRPCVCMSVCVLFVWHVRVLLHTAGALCSSLHCVSCCSALFPCMAVCVRLCMWSCDAHVACREIVVTVRLCGW